jgi:hypothetical protein
VILAPRHDRLAAEAGVAAHEDAHVRPLLAQHRHDALELVNGAGRSVDVGPPQPGHQQVVAAEDVERQVAVVAVVAVEEVPFLLAVQRVVGGVEVEHDLLGSRGKRLDEHVQQHLVDELLSEHDPLVAVRRGVVRSGQLDAIQRARRGQAHAAIACTGALQPLWIPLPDSGRQQRVEAQLVVVVEILVAQRDTEDALRQEVADRVLDTGRIPVVVEAQRELLDDLRALLDLLEQ